MKVETSLFLGGNTQAHTEHARYKDTDQSGKENKQ